ncbi:MAG: type I restriction enzyme HsdR N-terminal domain-containing protein [Cytophagales bacterium]
MCLTPEEWVRQHTINYLTTYLNYPIGRMRAEGKTSKVAGYWQRADILLYNETKGVSGIVECKSALERLCEATIQQMMRYNRGQVPLLIFTNGLRLFCFQRGDAHYVLCPEIPKFSYVS